MKSFTREGNLWLAFLGTQGGAEPFVPDLHTAVQVCCKHPRSSRITREAPLAGGSQGTGLTRRNPLLLPLPSRPELLPAAPTIPTPAPADAGEPPPLLFGFAMSFGFPRNCFYPAGLSPGGSRTGSAPRREAGRAFRTRRS